MDEVARAGPRMGGSGVGPLVLEYIDVLSMAGITRSAGLDLGIPDETKAAALAYLVVVLEHAHADEIPHLTGRFRMGDGYSRLARLRAAHAPYALATMRGMERASHGPFGPA